jgi:hypothetical protein
MGTEIYDNQVTTQQLPRNQEYDGCQLSGAIGLKSKFSGNIGVVFHDNTSTVNTAECEGAAAEVAEQEDGPPLSSITFRNNTLIGRYGWSGAYDPVSHSAASVLLENVNQGQVTFVGNTLVSDDLWVYGTQVDSQVFSENVFSIGPMPRPGQRPRFAYDWQPPSTSVTNVQFDDNAYGSATAKALFESSEWLSEDGAVLPTSNYSCGWTTTFHVVNGADAGVSAASVTITDTTGATAFTGATDSAGRLVRRRSGFRRRGERSCSRAPRSPVAFSTRMLPRKRMQKSQPCSINSS